MKKLILPLFAVLLLISCKREEFSLGENLFDPDMPGHPVVLDSLTAKNGATQLYWHVDWDKVNDSTVFDRYHIVRIPDLPFAPVTRDKETTMFEDVSVSSGQNYSYYLLVNGKSKPTDTLSISVP